MTLILFNISCNTNSKTGDTSKKSTSVINEKINIKKDTISNENDQLVDKQTREEYTLSEYNSDSTKTENIKRPEKSIIRNLEIDTTNAFGIWALDPDGPHADFLLDKDSFFVTDYDGDGSMPYILDKNEITVFYNDFIQTGIIDASVKDTLKIKWKDYEEEIIYVKFPE